MDSRLILIWPLVKFFCEFRFEVDELIGNCSYSVCMGEGEGAGNVGGGGALTL